MQDAAGRGSVKLVQIKGSNSNWQSLTNVWGASWETGQVPQPPLDFRVQDDAGVEVSHHILTVLVNVMCACHWPCLKSFLLVPLLHNSNSSMTLPCYSRCGSTLSSACYRTSQSKFIQVSSAVHI